MIVRNRAMAALFAGLTAGVLTLALPVEAQVPSTAPVVKPADTVNLTMEQRHVIKEIILKDLKVAALPALRFSRCLSRCLPRSPSSRRTPS
jgi:hypothetical protein